MREEGEEFGLFFDLVCLLRFFHLTPLFVPFFEIV